MRIIIITWEYPPQVVGDLAYYVARLASRLVEDGSEVFVVTFNDSKRGMERSKDGVNVYRVGNPVEPHQNILTWDLTLAVELERAFSDIYYSIGGGVDLIDAQEWLSIVPSTVLKNAFNIPFIYSVDNLEEHRSPYSNLPLNVAIKNLERLGTSESSKVLVKSEWMRSEVKKLHRIDGEKIVSIPPTSPTWDKEINKFYQRVIRQ